MSTSYLKFIHEIGKVRGVTIAVATESHIEGTAPHSIKAVMIDCFDGWHDIAVLDATDKGAVAKCISIAETVFDALEAAELTWFEMVD